MNPHEDPTTSQAERRGADRRATEAPLQLILDAQTLDGRTDNVSEMGILFFSDEALRVTVSWEDGGTRRTRKGRLVRAQRVDETRLGLAVEFDGTD